MILTQRLRLRQWNDDDLAPFAELNGDTETMAFMPKVLTRQESDDLARALQARIAERGWGLWAVEELATGEFVGFVGLGKPRFEASFVPCVEVGWRLLRKFWGNGYASEGGRASLGYGFEKLGLNEIVSFTTVTNMKSRRVMERIGMKRDANGDFNYPALAAGHPLRRHVLYRIKRDELAGSTRMHGRDAHAT